MTRLSVVTLMAVLALSACASTSFVSSWKAPDATPLQMKGEKVAAVVMLQNGPSRRAAEEALARELTERGVIGVPMYKVLPDATPGNEAAARTALESEGFAGVVVMRPIATQREISSTPVMYAGPVYGGYWGGYYGYGWGAPYAEIRTDTIVSVETLVYSLTQNKLVWAGQTRTMNPTNVNSFVDELADAATNELRKQGLIK